MNFRFNWSFFKGNLFSIVLLTFIATTAGLTSPCRNFAQDLPPAPKGLRIIRQAPGTVKRTAPVKIERKRVTRAGSFYELDTVLTQENAGNTPILEQCGKDKMLKIDSENNSLFTVGFYVNAVQVGSSYIFQRQLQNVGQWIGGANISRKSCAVGVIVDSGTENSYDYELYLVDTNTGAILFPEGIQFYPKVRNSGGVFYQGPRVWFSPDDSVAMIVAAADEIWQPAEKNCMAHFIDITSGQTIRRVLFQWPHTATSTTPYEADIQFSNGKRYIAFRVQRTLIERMVLP